MKKRSLAVLCSVLFAAIALVGCGNKAEQQNADAPEIRMFSEMTELALLQEVPILDVENGKIDIVGDMGAGNEVVLVNGSQEGEYWTYLETLAACGFEKTYDNGKEGLYGDVLTTLVAKDSLTVSVIHMKKTNLTYIVAEKNLWMSEHLSYSEEYVANNIEGAKTTLHMLEVCDFGESFVIQLKNGHFIVCDGGRQADLPYLIDYMTKLTPNNEKPVVEAWMISHPHGDHAALFNAFNDNWLYAEKLFVEGIYIDIYNEDVATRQSVTGVQLAIRTAALKLKTTDGRNPQIYRPQAGQTYYFCDITVDVMQSMIQTPEEDWYRWTGNVNEFSTWLMFNIDGQKFLNIGDADFGSMRAAMRTYDAEDFNMDIMAVSHHGINVHNEFSDYITVKTLLYPNYGTMGSFKEGVSWGGSWQASVTRNEYLQKDVLESYSYLDGTLVLSFPYEVGTAKSLGNIRPDRVPITDDTRIQYY